MSTGAVTFSPSVSIIVPVRDEAASVERCLRSLLGQTYLHILEILVVDGASRDATPEIVARLAAKDPRIRLLRNDDGRTPMSLNVGLLASSGEVICRIDGHAEAPADYVEAGVAALQATGAWCVGGHMRKVGRTPQQVAIARATSSPFGVGDADHNYATSARWVETVYLGMWWRRAFEQVGMFDPELTRNQDDELAYRVRQAGGRIWFEPKMSMDYTPRPSLRRLFSQYRQYGFWKVRVFQKHPGAVRLRHLVPAAWVTFAGLGLVASVLVPSVAPLWLVGILTYVAVVAYGAYRAGASIWRVAAALATVHAGYGIGFLQGLIRFATRWRGEPQQVPVLRPRGSTGGVARG